MAARERVSGAARICDSGDLAERGLAIVFDVVQWGHPARAFALRIDGDVVCYLNRCAHVPAELDWQPGRFLDAEARHIVCSIHGATYETAEGRCIGGPCGQGRLLKLDAFEADGGVWWRPTRDTRPPFED